MLRWLISRLGYTAEQALHCTTPGSAVRSGKQHPQELRGAQPMHLSGQPTARERERDDSVYGKEGLEQT